MNRLLCLLFLTLLPATAVFSQDYSLTFTSITDAKFFVYLNGQLKNERSSGMVTLRGLEDKEYHIRIVIDDPFEVAVTRSIRPDPKHCEYTVQFNAVRERVYLKPAKTKSEQEEWQPLDETQNDNIQNNDETTTRPRPQLRRSHPIDDETPQIIKHSKF